MKHLILLFIASIAFSSCSSYLSVEKRRHLGGFHIEQNFFRAKKYKKQEMNSSEQVKESDFNSSDSFALAQVENEKAEPEIIPDKKVLIFSKDYALKTNYSAKDTLPEKKKKHNGPQKDDEGKDVSGRDKRISPFAITGLVLSVIGFAFLFISFLGVILFSSASLVFALLARRQTNVHYDKYEGRGIVTASFVINVITLFIAAYLIYAWLSA